MRSSDDNALYSCCLFITPVVLGSIRGGSCWGGGDGFYDFRGQAEANVFGHHFEFLHVVIAFRR